MKNFRWIQNNTITFSASLMLTLVILNTGLSLYNNSILKENATQKAQIEQIKTINAQIWNDIVHNLDIGTRGYAIIADTVLLAPYHGSITRKDGVFTSLTALLKAIQYPAISGLDSLKTEVDDYQQVCAGIIQLVDSQDIEAVRQEVSRDRGKKLWGVYNSFTTRLNGYVDNLSQQAEASYMAATRRTAYLQLLLAIIGVPSLIFIIMRIQQDKKEKLDLFTSLEKNNRTYLFDPGTSIENIKEQEIIDASIVNFKKAAGFIQHISQGNYQAEWEGLDATNQQYNQTNLAGELMRMQEKMKQLMQAEQKRQWATEGTARFSEIIRHYQHDLPGLSDQIVSFTASYLNAQQAGLFLVNEQEEKYLELTACYAFERKKYVSRRVATGQGLVGQAYLEQLPTLLTNVPQGYTSITSGLGDATPGCLLVVPMAYNGRVEAVIEIASFQRIEAHQVDWLIKIGEIMASTLVSAKTAEKTNALLAEAQQQTEQMRAQEEEMRQNMEELQATQEETHRKQQEINQLLAETHRRESELQQQVIDVEQMKQQEEQTRRQETHQLNTVISSYKESEQQYQQRIQALEEQLRNTQA